MLVGGASGATLAVRLRANATDGKAWADRFLAQSPLIRVSKPMRKVLQFRAFSACQQSNGYCKYASAKLVFSQPPVRLGSFERHRVHTAVCIADLGLSSVAKTSLSAPVYPKVRWQPGVYALFDPALRRCGKLYHPQVVLKVRVASGQLDLNVTSHRSGDTDTIPMLKKHSALDADSSRVKSSPGNACCHASAIGRLWFRSPLAPWPGRAGAFREILAAGRSQWTALSRCKLRRIGIEGRIWRMLDSSAANREILQTQALHQSRVV